MDTPVKMLDHFRRCKLAISLDGNQLIVDHQGRMTDTFRGLINKVKPELVEHLRAMEIVLQEPEFFQSFLEDYFERAPIMEWDAPLDYQSQEEVEAAAREDVMRVHTNFVEDKPIGEGN